MMRFSFTIRGRTELEAGERDRLAPWAIPSVEGVRGSTDTAEDDLRPAFQRDRDRILHSRAFRRLKHKTQVFVPHLGDHPRTRLTHTLEVAQLARTIARAMGLNEDLVEAIALGHDLGHTAFGHTGEGVLRDVLAGAIDEVPLPPEVVAGAGAFKHNYQSLRVVDLLERRYQRPGLDLTHQVREGILKHTGWRPDFDFPLPSTEGLNLHRPCHLEGQVVAVADEIAQQTHDLEDGLRAKSVALSAVEKLEISRRVVAVDGGAYEGEKRGWMRQNILIRGLIRLFVKDVIDHTGAQLARLAGNHPFTDREGYLAVASHLPPTTAWFSPSIQPLFEGLKAFIYEFIINHPRVNRQDWRARKVMVGLFNAFWTSPLNLPTYVLLRAREELGFPYLREVAFGRVAEEVRSRYHASPGFARLVTDHLAGMSDRYALEEYRSLEQPGIDSLTGDL